jgi:hypothetical protein
VKYYLTVHYKLLGILIKCGFFLKYWTFEPTQSSAWAYNAIILNLYPNGNHFFCRSLILKVQDNLNKWSYNDKLNNKSCIQLKIRFYLGYIMSNILLYSSFKQHFLIDNIHKDNQEIKI